MAKADKYTWTFSGRQRTWDFAIQKEGFTATATAMLAGAEAFLTWGRPSNELSESLLPCDIKIEILDPDLALYNELIDPDLEEDDFRLVATDSTGTYTLRMRVRLDTVETFLVPNLQEQVTSLYGYCGLSEIKNIDALLLTSHSVHKIFRDILSLTLISQNIEYLTGIYPNNIASADPVLDLVRLNRLDLIFAEEGRKVDNMADQLQGMVDGWGVTAFNGLDGQWHVKHRWGLGETITTGRGKQRYILASNTLISLNTLSQSTLTLAKPIIHRATTRRILKPVQAVEIERGTNREFITVDLARHGDFETGWTSSTAHEVWTINNGSIARSTQEDTGTWAMRIDDSNSSVETVITHLAASSQNFIEITFRYAIELTPAGSGGTKSLTITAVFDPIDPAEVIDYTATDGTWEADAVANTFSASATAQANGTDPLTYSTFSKVIEAPLPPVDGKLIIRLQGDAGTDYYVHIDNFELRLNNTSSSSVNKWRSVFPRVLPGLDFFNEQIATRGEIVRHSRAWHVGTVGVDTDADGTRDELHELLQADTDGAGTWTQPSKYTSEGWEFSSTTYDDLAKATSDARINEQDAPAQIIEGEILGIVTPHIPFVWESKTYIPVYARVDLKREVTQVTGVEKLLTFELQPGQPDTMYLLNSSEQVLSAPIDLNNTGWSTATLFSFTGTALNLKVDQAAGYAFVYYQTAGPTTLHVDRFDLADGANQTSIYTSTSASRFSIDLDRNAQRLYILEAGTGVTEIIRVYEYDGTADTTYATSQTINLGSIALADDASYAVYANSDSPPLGKKNDLGGSDSTIVTFTGESNNLANGEAVVDSSAGYWFLCQVNIGNEKLLRVPLPSGGSFSTIISNNNDGVAIDKFNQLIYYVDGSGNVDECDYDGNNVRDSVVVSSGIVSIDLGV